MVIVGGGHLAGLLAKSVPSASIRRAPSSLRGPGQLQQLVVYCYGPAGEAATRKDLVGAVDAHVRMPLAVLN